MEINNGDDNDGDDVITEKPGRRDALAASLTLQKYIADIDEPFARQLEALLLYIDDWANDHDNPQSQENLTERTDLMMTPPCQRLKTAFPPGAMGLPVRP